MLKSLLISLLQYHPLVISVLASVAISAILFVAPTKFVDERGRRAMLAVSALMVLNYFLIVLIYAIAPVFFDHIEPTVVSVAWGWARLGRPLYEDPSASERYTMLYGPMLYMVFGWFERLFGANMFVAKLPGICAGIVSPVALFATFAPRIGRRAALLVSGFLATFFLYFGNMAFNSRADSLLLMLVSVSLLSVIRGTPAVALIVTAVAAGMAVNLKAHAFLYFAPIAVLLFERSRRHFWIALVTGVAVGLAPFTLFPRISLPVYIFWLRSAAKHPLSAKVFLQNVELMATLFAPGMLILLNEGWTAIRMQVKQLIWMGAALVISCIMISGIASKVGAGPTHFIPMLPLVAWFTVGLLPQSSFESMWRDALSFPSAGVKRWIVAGALGLVAAVTVGAAFQEAALLRAIGKYRNIAVDLADVKLRHSNSTIEMGYGSPVWDATELRDYRLSFERPVLIFYQIKPYFLDAAALMDMELSGIAIPSQTIDDLRTCQVSLWLIPKGDVPFRLKNLYPGLGPLFDQDFQSAFLQNYEAREQSRYFDLWFCRNSQTAQLSPGR